MKGHLVDWSFTFSHKKPVPLSQQDLSCWLRALDFAALHWKYRRPNILKNSQARRKTTVNQSINQIVTILSVSFHFDDLYFVLLYIDKYILLYHLTWFDTFVLTSLQSEGCGAPPSCGRFSDADISVSRFGGASYNDGGKGSWYDQECARSQKYS